MCEVGANFYIKGQGVTKNAYTGIGSSKWQAYTNCIRGALA